MKDFWFVTLCAFLIAASVFGLSIPLRIAIGANACIILLDVARQIWGIRHGTEEEKN